MTREGLAILCGNGDLPRLLAEKCKVNGQQYIVVQFQGVNLEWASDHPVVNAEFEKASALIKLIHASGCNTVTLAGSIQRPSLNPLKFDLKGMKLAASVLGAQKKGDDESLRIVAKMFEDEGLSVVAAHSILHELTPGAGVVGKFKPSDIDKQDADKAALIVSTLGDLDIGQGAVVAQGLCLAIETVQGTDQMLEFVAQTKKQYINDENLGMGVLYKAPKPGQDRRMDLPTIGTETIKNVKNAGLAGIVIEADGVLVLELDEVIKLANNLGVFIWAKESN